MLQENQNLHVLQHLTQPANKFRLAEFCGFILCLCKDVARMAITRVQTISYISFKDIRVVAMFAEFLTIVFCIYFIYD